VSALGALVMLGAGGLLFAAYSGPPILKVLALLLLLIPPWNIYSLGYRSQIASLLFFAGEIFFLEKAERSSKMLWLLPPLFMFWANTHPGFFLGPMVLGLFLAAFWVRSFREEGLTVRRVAPGLLLLFISLAATLVNPFGPRIYGEVWRHFLVPMNTLIAEWVGPDRSQVLLILGSFLAMGGLIFLRRGRWGWRFPVLALFAFLAVTGRRNLPLYYLALYAALFGSGIMPDIKRDAGEALETIAVPVLLVALLFALKIIPQAVRFNTDEAVYCHEGLVSYPCQAIGYFREKQGNIFNTYEWGGFLIWKLPAMKVFVDGRMPAWETASGKSPYAIFLEIIQARPGWNETLARYQTGYIFIAPGTFLDLELEDGRGRQYGWEEKYRDAAAVIYEKI
jgi:hypothetical protein